MSRHSKWSKVKQFKGAIDAKRAASFTKLACEITIASKEKGPDPSMNARLRTAIDRAREASMPKDSIERAIRRGAGGTGEAALESPTYEAYAPGGTALIIECVTDNRNRTTNDVKHLVTKAGGSLAGAGSVAYLFDHVGVVRFLASPPYEGGDGEGVKPWGDTEAIELALIDAGASEIIKDEDHVEIHCSQNDLARVADVVVNLGFTADLIEMQWIPKSLIETDEATGTLVADLIEELEELDDVSKVFSNLA